MHVSHPPNTWQANGISRPSRHHIRFPKAPPESPPCTITAAKPRLHQIHARLKKKKKRHVYMCQKPISAMHPSIVFVSASCIARMLFFVEDRRKVEQFNTGTETRKPITWTERRSSMPVYFAKNAQNCVCVMLQRHHPGGVFEPFTARRVVTELCLYKECS